MVVPLTSALNGLPGVSQPQPLPTQCAVQATVYTFPSPSSWPWTTNLPEVIGIAAVEQAVLGS